jgi:hypothetical protein
MRTQYNKYTIIHKQNNRIMHNFCMKYFLACLLNGIEEGRVLFTAVLTVPLTGSVNRINEPKLQ